MKNNKKAKGLPAGEMLTLAFNFIVALAVYYGCIALGERMQSALPYQLCTGICIVGAIVLPALSAFLSGKYTFEKAGKERTPGQLRLSRRLILWAIPLIAVLLIDIIDLFVVEYLKDMLASAL